MSIDLSLSQAQAGEQPILEEALEAKKPGKKGLGFLNKLTAVQGVVAAASLALAGCNAAPQAAHNPPSQEALPACTYFDPLNGKKYEGQWHVCDLKLKHPDLALGDRSSLADDIVNKDFTVNECAPLVSNGYMPFSFRGGRAPAAVICLAEDSQGQRQQGEKCNGTINFTFPLAAQGVLLHKPLVTFSKEDAQRDRAVPFFIGGKDAGKYDISFSPSDPYNKCASYFVAYSYFSVGLGD